MTHDTIYEFRDYTLHEGQRDVLIDLFEREFIEPQEALGAHVRAMFRDIDNPDRFVWMRSFADAAARLAALDGFYTGPVWQAHRNAANATIIDSDNVMQLRPISGALASDAGETTGVIASTAYFLAPSAEEDFIRRFTREVVPALGAATPFASFLTDHAPNAYPHLPTRTNETVFLTFTRVHAGGHNEEMTDLLSPMLVAPTEVRRLQPTARSVLR